MAQATLRIVTNDPSSPKDIALSSLIGNQAQTAECDPGFTGDDVTIAAGQHTAQTLAIANAAALAAAEAALECVEDEVGEPGTDPWDFSADVNDEIQVVIVDAADQTFVGGDFTEGASGAVNLAKIGPNNLVVTTFLPNPNGIVYALAKQADGKLLVGGFYSTIDGDAQANLARLNADGTRDTSFNPVVDSLVNQIVVLGDGKIFICGVFNTVNSVTMRGIAKLNADGSLDTSFADPGNGGTTRRRDMVVNTDGSVVTVGDFTGITCVGAERITSTGVRDATFTIDNAFDEESYRIARASSTVLFIAQEQNLRKIDNDGVIDHSFSVALPGVPASSLDAYGLLVDSANSVLYVCGVFTTADGEATARIAKISFAGTVNTGFDPNVTNNLRSIAMRADGSLMVGGRHTSWAGNSGSAVQKLTHCSAANGSII